MSEQCCGTCKWWGGLGKNQAMFYACKHPVTVAIAKIPRKVKPHSVRTDYIGENYGAHCNTYEAKP